MSVKPKRKRILIWSKKRNRPWDDFNEVPFTWNEVRVIEDRGQMIKVEWNDEEKWFDTSVTLTRDIVEDPYDPKDTLAGVFALLMVAASIWGAIWLLGMATK